ncbi:MAG: hypothetical protein KC766_29410 [Myxococcales bacterium]|nr:hypothetical protein [Myxococcales bacterium]
MRLAPPHPGLLLRWRVALSTLLCLCCLEAGALAQAAPPGVPAAGGTQAAEAKASSAAAAAPADASNRELFHSAARALGQGSFDTAIDELELLADRGFVHPDASFDRGVAYSRRAETRQVQPGDYGRAAAAFQECLRLRPGDSEAARALAAVEGQITRRRSREGREPVVVNASLSRAVVNLVSEDTWALLAALSALALSVGLGLRLWSRSPRTRFSGGVAAAVAGVALLLFGVLTFSSRHFRVTTRPAVIVATEARLLDVQGRPLPKTARIELEAIPEGALVWILERNGSLARIEWGTTEGWVAVHQLQPLASAEDISAP